MKYCTIIKVGYSSGIYGCSGEYFTCIYTNKRRGLSSFKISGMYGVEERVARAMEAKKFKTVYVASGYGKLTGEDKKFFLSEYEVIDRDSKLKIELDK